MKFNKLKALCIERDIPFSKFCKDCKIQGHTLMAILGDGNVTVTTLDRICSYFKCQPCDIMESEREWKEKQREFKKRMGEE